LQNAHNEEELVGLGHAFEMNPDLENGFYSLAEAQMTREITNCPLNICRQQNLDWQYL
jgi:beta-lysine 5,6-aminomutase alpha subunit